MKVIISGSRDLDDWDWFKNKMEYEIFDFNDVEFVSGGCSDAKNGKLTFTRDDGRKIYGVDGMAERYAKEFGVKIKIFDADWDKFGRAAGPIRNTDMAIYARSPYGLCLCFSRNNSKGTADMAFKAKKWGLTAKKFDYENK